MVAGSSGVKKLKNLLFLVRAITTCSYNNKNDPSDSKKLMMWKTEKKMQAKGNRIQDSTGGTGSRQKQENLFPF